MIRVFKERQNPWEVTEITEEAQIPKILGIMLAESLSIFGNFKYRELNNRMIEESSKRPKSTLQKFIEAEFKEIISLDDEFYNYIEWLQSQRHILNIYMRQNKASTVEALMSSTTHLYGDKQYSRKDRKALFSKPDMEFYKETLGDLNKLIKSEKQKEKDMPNTKKKTYNEIIEQINFIIDNIFKVCRWAITSNRKIDERHLEQSIKAIANANHIVPIDVRFTIDEEDE